MEGATGESKERHKNFVGRKFVNCTINTNSRDIFFLTNNKGRSSRVSSISSVRKRETDGRVVAPPHSINNGRAAMRGEQGSEGEKKKKADSEQRRRK